MCKVCCLYRDRVNYCLLQLSKWDPEAWESRYSDLSLEKNCASFPPSLLLFSLRQQCRKDFTKNVGRVGEFRGGWNSRVSFPSAAAAGGKMEKKHYHYKCPSQRKVDEKWVLQHLFPRKTPKQGTTQSATIAVFSKWEGKLDVASLRKDKLQKRGE